MQTQDELNDGAKAGPSVGGVANASRRRFARAGFAAPVVLASLSSKPVLGAVPKACTVSGMVSGNLSTGTGGTGSCLLGQSRAQWLTQPTWPAITKGSLPGPNCAFPGGSAPGTPFNGFGTALVPGGLAARFFYEEAADKSACVVTTNAIGGQAASMYQVLASTAADTQTQLAQAVIVSLLNFYSLGNNYPVTASTIIKFFNDTNSGGMTQINDTQSWTSSQVLSYLTSLYPR